MGWAKTTEAVDKNEHLSKAREQTKKGFSNAKESTQKGVKKMGGFFKNLVKKEPQFKGEAVTVGGASKNQEETKSEEPIKMEPI